jgi:hypothetical protein
MADKEQASQQGFTAAFDIETEEMRAAELREKKKRKRSAADSTKWSMADLIEREAELGYEDLVIDSTLTHGQVC